MSVESTNNIKNWQRQPMGTVNENNIFLQHSVSDFIAMVQACPHPHSRSVTGGSSDFETTSSHPSMPQKQQRKRSMSRVISSPALVELKQSHTITKVEVQQVQQRQQSAVDTQRKKARIRHSISAPTLYKQVFGGASASTVTKDRFNEQFANTDPNDYLKGLLQAMGVLAHTRPSLSLDDFFLEMTNDHMRGYGADIISAIREEDLDALSRIRDSGGTLQCCNKFGESIVHMACRRGSTNVVHYLLRNGVSIRLVDDYGRTPLHDAFWTQEPEFELVKTIILECPDLLYVTDKRGFTPLSYVRRDHWGEWCAFLEKHRNLVVPRELLY